MNAFRTLHIVNTIVKTPKEVIYVLVPSDFYSTQTDSRVETWTSVPQVKTFANRIVSTQRAATNVLAKKDIVKLVIIAKVRY